MANYVWQKILNGKKIKVYQKKERKKSNPNFSFLSKKRKKEK